MVDIIREASRIEKILVVNDFLDMFPDELSGFFQLEIEWVAIDLAPETEPVSKTPYWLAQVKMKELVIQLQGLLKKGVLRPNILPAGASLKEEWEHKNVYWLSRTE